MSTNAPKITRMEPGTYHWCSCGKSQLAPLCDGAHQGTDCTPVEFVIDEKKTVALCGCRRTKQPPFCDGSHARID